MRIDNAWQNRPAPSVKDSSSGRDGKVGARTDCRDAIALDHDDAVCDGGSARAIDDGSVFNDERIDRHGPERWQRGNCRRRGWCSIAGRPGK